MSLLGSFVGLRCRVHVRVTDVDLFYIADVLAANDTHIFFRDKKAKCLCFRNDHVIQVTKLADSV